MFKVIKKKSNNIYYVKTSKRKTNFNYIKMNSLFNTNLFTYKS